MSQLCFCPFMKYKILKVPAALERLTKASYKSTPMMIFFLVANSSRTLPRCCGCVLYTEHQGPPWAWDLSHRLGLAGRCNTKN